MGNVWMDIAERLARESKCVSHSVGAVLVKDNHIISSGVNGTLPGYMNCCDRFPEYNNETDREEHHRWANIHEIHSEKNLLSWVDRKDTEGSQCYVTVEPCIHCFKDLLQAKVSAIYFKNPYDKNEYRQEMISLAASEGVVFERKD